MGCPFHDAVQSGKAVAGPGTRRRALGFSQWILAGDYWRGSYFPLPPRCGALPEMLAGQFVTLRNAVTAAYREIEASGTQAGNRTRLTRD